jgi:hypothetical protein
MLLKLDEAASYELNDSLAERDGILKLASVQLPHAKG